MQACRALDATGPAALVDIAAFMITGEEATMEEDTDMA